MDGCVPGAEIQVNETDKAREFRINYPSWQSLVHRLAKDADGEVIIPPQIIDTRPIPTCPKCDAILFHNDAGILACKCGFVVQPSEPDANVGFQSEFTCDGVEHPDGVG